MLDEHLDWCLRDDPAWAAGRGDERAGGRLRDESPEAYAARAEQLKERLTRLLSLDPAAFTDEDRLDSDLLRFELELAVEGAPFHPEQTPIDARTGPQIWLPQLGDQVPMRTPKHLADHVARLEAIPVLIDQHIAQMRLGMAAGRTLPKVVMIGAAEQCLSLGSADVEASPGLSPFFGPFRALAPDDELAGRAKRAIREGIVPAFKRLGEFLRDEYLPACRESTSIADTPDGAAAYDFALRKHTSLEVTARQVHEIGLAEVARIRAEMMQVIRRSDYPNLATESGDELFHGFLRYLRTDPRFYCTTAEELLAGYRDVCKRIDAELPRLFRTLPQLPYGVKEMAPLMAPAAPTAYYFHGSLKTGLPGWFIANTHRLDQRPKYEMIALAMHEAVPGHHLQVSLSDEAGGRHPFRTAFVCTGYSEGWALYAERLGLEMGEMRADAESGPRGLYADPYDDFGRLTYEMWRACRMVVDPALHTMGWSRQKAIDYMAANTALALHNIEREVDRYIAWPAQACAYKLGELKIRDLRARAERILGERFDVRAFHEAVLDAGVLPLPTLDAKVERWIEVERVRPPGWPPR